MESNIFPCHIHLHCVSVQSVPPPFEMTLVGKVDDSELDGNENDPYYIRHSVEAEFRTK
jgi:hypothetical protein